jgi:hypothetical protein
LGKTKRQKNRMGRLNYFILVTGAWANNTIKKGFSYTSFLNLCVWRAVKILNMKLQTYSKHFQ